MSFISARTYFSVVRSVWCRLYRFWAFADVQVLDNSIQSSHHLRPEPFFCVTLKECHSSSPCAHRFWHSTSCLYTAAHRVLHVAVQCLLLYDLGFYYLFCFVSTQPSAHPCVKMHLFSRADNFILCIHHSLCVNPSIRPSIHPSMYTHLYQVFRLVITNYAAVNSCL